MFNYALFQALVVAAVLVSAVPMGKRAPRPAKRASCTVDSVDAASSISDCSSVTISYFTVASGGER